MNANSSVEPWSCVNDKWRWVQCHSAPYCYGRTYLVKLGQYPDNYHVILKYFYTYKYATLFCHNSLVKEIGTGWITFLFCWWFMSCRYVYHRGS